MRGAPRKGGTPTIPQQQKKNIIRRIHLTKVRHPYSPQDFSGLGTSELIQRFRSQGIEVGKALAHANMGIRVEGKIIYQRSKMGRFYACNRLLSETEAELLKRLSLGVVSKEISNRPAFIFLASHRAVAACRHCRKEPLNGQGLNFWTKEMKGAIPLPLMMAWGGGSVEKIREAMNDCEARCRSCAKRLGGKLLANGRVDLQAYDVEVT